MNEFFSCLKTYSLPKPGRYIDSEYSQKKQEWHADRLKILLAFPDLYEIGTSYLGYFLLYNHLVKDDDILVDRIYAPDRDTLQFLQSRNTLLPSLYFQKPGKEFDCIGFSLQTELSCTTLVKMIEISGIPVLAENRTDQDPLILCGGAGAYNPEPYADFIDAFVIGDGEEVFEEIILLLKDSFSLKRREKLKRLSKIPGVYIPAFYRPQYNEKNQLCGFDIQDGLPARIQKRVFDINKSPFPCWYLIPSIRPVHDRLIVEASRGCLNACRFCQAGYIHRPLREKNPQRICEEILRGLTQTGYNEVSLLSLSLADYSRLSDIIRTLSPFLQQYHVKMSFPSLRIEKFIEHLEDGPLSTHKHKTSFTFAPEAGTEKLRQIINKNITDEEIFETISLAFSRGWQTIKLYFMLGLPGEEPEDMEGIISIIRKAAASGARYHRRYHVNVSLSPFIPKSHTPFQWSQHFNISSFEEKIYYIRNCCKKLKNVTIKFPDLFMNRIEAFLARADRRASEVILEAVKNGAYLDTWDEHFQASSWNGLLGTFEEKYKYHINQPYKHESVLPWDIIDSGIRKDYFLQETQKALGMESTPNCLGEQGCYGCGACNPLSGKNILASQEKISSLPPSRILKSAPKVFRCWVIFTKHFPASFTGHLDYIRNIEYILRRAHLPMIFTEGFHPKVKVSFYDALPLFWESDCEIMEVFLSESIDPAEAVEALNQTSIAGIQFRKILPLPGNTPHLNKLNICSRYRINFPSEVEDSLLSALEADGNIKSAAKTLPSAIEIEVPGNKKKFRPILEERGMDFTIIKTQMNLTLNNRAVVL